MPSDSWKCYNWFSGKSEERILNWRRYRNSLSLNPAAQVAADWAECPTISNYLTHDNPADWPDAWQLISTGMYCDIGVALGMFYTLYYSNYRHRNTMVLQCFKDQKNHQYLNLLILPEEKYMLNYSWGQVVNTSTIHSEVLLINTLTKNDLKI